jgi:hypothetical protein
MKPLLPTLLASLALGSLAAFGGAAAPKTATPAPPVDPVKPALARVETIDLQARGRIVLTPPAGWTVVREDPDNPLSLVLNAPAGVNAMARLTFGFAAQGNFESAADVRTRATELGESELDTSVEKRVVLQTYKLRSGYGYYSSYTDPDLVGKKPVPGDYKYITVGVIRLAPGIIGIVQILCDDLAGTEHKQLQQVVETLELLGPGGARRKAEF